MSTPILTWICIAVLFVIIVLARALASVSKKHHFHHQFIEIGKERDEFFIPGDPLGNCNDLNDYDGD